MIGIDNSAYPPLLREIHDPPPVLYCRGIMPDPLFPAVAIVGTRRPSSAALSQAYRIAREFGAAGITVVSGLALGIDAMAHRGCIDGGGRTVAVLGSSLDQVYPVSNRALAARILGHGGAIISEYPPGTRPYKSNFPQRNRIISGISRGTLVVEAPSHSGALHTANFALEQGRDLWVGTSGTVSPLGEGTARLAADGARVIANAAEILAEWGFDAVSGIVPERKFSASTGFELAEELRLELCLN